MKLQELAAPSPAKQVAKMFESYFGSRVSFDDLSLGQSKSLLRRVQSILEGHKSTVDHHFSERDPAYLKLVMLETALTARISEQMATAPTTTTPGAVQQDATKMAAATIATTKDPRVKAALTKASKGQNLTPDEQKLVAGAALMKTESRTQAYRRALQESEVQQAQVVLAAQDMVDNIQGILEDVTEMQYKELPALVDGIRNQVGIEQANQFNTDATTALTTLVQNLQTSKQQLETALGVVTGQAQPTPALDAAMGAEMPDMSAAIGDEPEADLEVDADLEVEPDEPAGARSALGRSRR